MSARRAPGDTRKQPCRYYLQGDCWEGERCRFEHSRASSPAQEASSQHKPQDNLILGKMRTFKRLLHPNLRVRLGEAPQYEIKDLGTFFKIGLELIQSKPETAQETFRHLGSENGLRVVIDFLEMHITPTSSTADQARLWYDCAQPLFLIMTHPCICDSALLEDERSRLLNCLRGIEGTRMYKLFLLLDNLLPHWLQIKYMNMTSIETIRLALDVLYRILANATDNILNFRFGEVADRLECHLKDTSSNRETEIRCRNLLDRIRRRLDIGKAIPDFKFRPIPLGAVPSFEMKIDGPGDLSLQGRPRHDNDHADITKIQIMPTLAEIMSTYPAYLPSTDSRTWHLTGPRGRLDREFRLLREDTIGQLRDAIRDVLKPQEDRRDLSRTYVYEDPILRRLHFDTEGQLELVIRIPQPPAIACRSAQKRKEFWEQSKRLRFDSLVCLCDSQGAVVFCTVTRETLRFKGEQRDDQFEGPPSEGSDDTGSAPLLTLADDAKYSFLKLNLVEPSEDVMVQIAKWYKPLEKAPIRYLVEFPNTLLASFKHTLEALQRTYANDDLPFGDLIAPTELSANNGRLGGPIDIGPPAYLTTPGVALDLSSIVHGNAPLYHSYERPASAYHLSQASALDESQAEALTEALIRRVALVQGPPGTGKSFTGQSIIKVLVHNKDFVNLGPVLCVCYTNHALDQLLKNLLDSGVSNIIRIGSKSKSERLKDLNLRHKARQTPHTKSESKHIGELKRRLAEQGAEANSIIKSLLECDTWQSLRDQLPESHPELYRIIFGEDDDGRNWSKALRNRNPLQQWFHNGHPDCLEPRPIEELLYAHDLQHLARPEREELHRYWAQRRRLELTGDMVNLMNEMAIARDKRNRIWQDHDLRCLYEADVIGITTTGLAVKLDLIRNLRTKVMICEEAGEVLEAHVLAALIPGLDQAILIGDHLQLRPQIRNYELQSANLRGERFPLDTSLFERLVQPKYDFDHRLRFTTLEIQRRMHPSISALLRRTLYPKLKDDDKVASYPAVAGLHNRLYWFHHEHLEDDIGKSEATSTSLTNKFEAEMIAALVTHIVRQGQYGPQEIAVITPYLGQLLLLKKTMGDRFGIAIGDRDQQDIGLMLDPSESDSSTSRGQIQKTTLLQQIRLATVDNFQGEEARVIIVSIVRSNRENRCGFLSTSNRINVLLSRAQHGMFIIGNANTYRSVDMWRSVIEELQSKGNFGHTLPLQCPRHPKTSMAVAVPEDFTRHSPDGGCIEKCTVRLPCGHQCTARCHSEILHQLAAANCLEECPTTLPGCGHPCPNICREDCPERCEQVLDGVVLILPCGHIRQSPACWENQQPAEVICTELVARVLDCGHQVDAKCNVKVEHLLDVCKRKCGKPLDTCGHPCRRHCHQCQQRDDTGRLVLDHGACTRKCDRPFTTCQHSCDEFCHGERPCPPCHEPCETACSHSVCDKKCSEPCTPCAERSCESRCKHSQCTMPCGAPCDWIPCSRRCSEVLSCGHQCPSLCGEPCPSQAFCQTCGDQDNLKTVVDYSDYRTYGQIDLDKMPCIMTPCQHILTVESMDNWMSMNRYYELDTRMNPISLKHDALPFSETETKQCVICRKSVRAIRRYGRITRLAMLVEAAKRFLTTAVVQEVRIGNWMCQARDQMGLRPEPVQQNPRTMGMVHLPADKNMQMVKIDELTGGRYAALLLIRLEAVKHAQQTRTGQHPFEKVADLVRLAKIRQPNTRSLRFDEGIVRMDTHLRANLLVLQCECYLLQDFVLLCERGVLPIPANFNLEPYLKESEGIIASAVEAGLTRDEVVARTLCVQFCALARAVPLPRTEWSRLPPSTPSAGRKEAWMTRGLIQLHSIRETLVENQSLLEGHTSLEKLDALEKALIEGATYQPMNVEEMRGIIRAMEAEFPISGHWWRCERGHPFVIGECGMPMEEARCPQCGSPIGGTDHQAAAGVVHASEIEGLVNDTDGLTV